MENAGGTRKYLQFPNFFAGMIFSAYSGKGRCEPASVAL
jgi:hypothetical protein